MAAAEGGGCPVKHGGAGDAGSAATCPVGEGGAAEAMLRQAGAATEGKVELDPRNNMPKVAEQKMWPGQEHPLPTYRQESVIPKADFTPAHQSNTQESSSWVYPSEQQFYNAMKRKGWKPREEDMKVVLSIHNHVNDKAWSEVLKWEQMHADECDAPKLLRFMGKPKELSPKATMRTWVGYARPFDRHDWVVDRCGREVRYIIDFYQGNRPSAGSQEVVSMYLDARPALDSWSALADRARMGVRDALKSVGLGPSSPAAPAPEA